MVSLIPWSDKRELDRFEVDIDRLFERFFEPRPYKRIIRSSEWMPAMDVSETDKEILINAEIPGMEAKDLDISLSGRILTLKGERKNEHEEKDVNIHRVERSYGTFTRSFELPAEIDPDKVEADYKDGILKIKLTKSEAQKTKKIEIKAS